MPRLRPLQPIFDPPRRRGIVDVGITPSSLVYDDVVLTEIGALWYSRFAQFNAPIWPSYTTVAFGDYRSESQQGLYWFNAWYAESGLVPATYDLTAAPLGLLWYSTLDATNAPIWPSLATVIAGDYRNESQQGLYWFNAWYAESGFAPIDYDATVPSLGPIWNSKLDSTSSAPAGLPVGGTITTPGDGYRYHTFTNADNAANGRFWPMDPAGKAVEMFAIAGGASGGRPNTAANYGGGGGAGERTVISATIDSDGVIANVGAAVAAPASGVGTTGNNTVLTYNGSTVTLLGGRGGGSPLVSAGAGGTGGGSGGGGGAASGVSGTGGAGSTGGNDGGGGGGSATAAQNRAGGGGGANAAGTTGVANGQVGNGGQGYEWPPGSGVRYGGGGGGATGTGTAAGGAGGGGNAGTGAGTTATANTGSGGGGGAGTSVSGGSAGGRVIIRYPFP